MDTTRNTTRLRVGRVAAMAATAICAVALMLSGAPAASALVPNAAGLGAASEAGEEAGVGEATTLARRTRSARPSASPLQRLARARLRRRRATAPARFVPRMLTYLRCAPRRGPPLTSR
jgi:hypothetical protein